MEDKQGGKAMERIRNQEGGKQLGVLSLLMWEAIVLAPIVVLIALCLLYPDAAIFNKLGIPLQW